MRLLILALHLSLLGTYSARLTDPKLTLFVGKQIYSENSLDEKLKTNRTGNAAGLDAYFRLAIESPVPRDTFEIDSLYEDASGQVIAQLSTNTHDIEKVYFWNGKRFLYDIDDRSAFRLGNTPFALSRFTKSLGLRQLSPAFSSVSLPSGFGLLRDHLDAPHCQWPYGSLLTLTYQGSFIHEFSFLVKKPTPSKQIYDMTCDSGTGSIALSTTYSNATPSMFTTTSGRLFITFGKPALALQFQPVSQGSSCKVCGDVIVADGDFDKKVLQQAIGGHLSSPEAISQFETSVLLLK